MPIKTLIQSSFTPAIEFAHLSYVSDEYHKLGTRVDVTKLGPTSAGQNTIFMDWNLRDADLN